MSNDDNPERMQHQPTSDDAVRNKSDNEACPSAKLKQQLGRLEPRYDNALTARTLYEAGLRAGRKDRPSSRFLPNGRLLAGFATGVAATLVIMQFKDPEIALPESQLAESSQQVTPLPPMHAFVEDAVAEDIEQPFTPLATFDLSALLEQTLARRMDYDNSSLRDQFLRGHFETVSAKPTLTYGQWIQNLNRGDTSLLD